MIHKSFVYSRKKRIVHYMAKRLACILYRREMTHGYIGSCVSDPPARTMVVKSITKAAPVEEVGTSPISTVQRPAMSRFSRPASGCFLCGRAELNGRLHCGLWVSGLCANLCLAAGVFLCASLAVGLGLISGNVRCMRAERIYLMWSRE